MNNYVHENIVRSIKLKVREKLSAAIITISINFGVLFPKYVYMCIANSCYNSRTSIVRASREDKIAR